MKILLIEDDELVVQPLVKAFSEQHDIVDVAADGATGKELADCFDYDLILLDIGLPNIDGITLCKQLRSAGIQTPILLLTALDASTNKVRGLDAGADDYVTKPYDWLELSARIRALLRRGSSPTSLFLEWDQLKLMPNTHEVFYDEQPLHLTPKEYGLLELFLRNPQRVFSRSSILEHLWEFEELPEEETIRSHIRGLRNKLKAVGASDPIDTVYGIGYRLKPLPADRPANPSPHQFHDGAPSLQSTQAMEPTLLSPALAKTTHTRSASATPISIASDVTTQPTLRGKLTPHAEQQAMAAIATLWERARKKFSARVTVIEQATTAMSTRTLSPTLRQQAEHEAHRLAGALGIYNLFEGSRLAQEMELLLHMPTPLMPNQQQRLAELVIALREELETSTAPPTTQHDTTLSGITSSDTETKEDSTATPNGQPHTFTVLAVDDDSEVLAMLRHIIEPWGIRLSTLENPEQIWEALTQISPDLLILDVAMPQMSGIELCQAIRDDARWGDLPVLFLTAYTNTAIMQQVFTSGADDYVSKPIVEPELITRILNRLERSRLRRHVMETDMLTKVANRRKMTQDLQRFFSCAIENETSVCLAILNLDQVHSINEAYGYSAGDEALSWFGSLLLQQFPGQTCIARWGGVKFMVGIYDATAQEGHQRLKQLQRTLQQQPLPLMTEHPIHLTFSAGVGEYPHDGSDLSTLYQAVNPRMLRAQAAGGDRIVAIEEIPP